MEIIYKPVSDLIPYENNPRKNDQAVDALANSISEFGFRNPIIIGTDNVIASGHTRLKAAIKLGMTEVPCLIADDLTEEQLNAFRLADNKVAELAEWDEDKLLLELQELDFDMTQFGFEEFDFAIDDIIEPEEKPEVEFAEVLNEQNNYIVLKFNNEVDWLQAQSVFDIKPVKCYSTRNDGEITEKMQRIGQGRVLDGAKAIRDIMGENV